MSGRIWPACPLVLPQLSSGYIAWLLPAIPSQDFCTAATQQLGIFPCSLLPYPNSKPPENHKIAFNNHKTFLLKKLTSILGVGFPSCSSHPEEGDIRFTVSSAQEVAWKCAKKTAILTRSSASTHLHGKELVRLGSAHWSWHHGPTALKCQRDIPRAQHAGGCS